MTRVLVIGAGPAGLAAARAAREEGATVTLLDSSDEVGGQYWRHLPPSRPSAHEAKLHHGWGSFVELRSRLEADAGCEIVTSAHVWAIEPSGAGVVHVLVGEPDGNDRERRELTTDALILATGAYDRTLPFPGWDLPGVFSAGAAQALAKGERVSIGERVLVAGAGPFLLPVAASLAATGATVVGILEANRARSLVSGWLPRPWELFRTAGKGSELGGYVLGQVRNRIPYRLGKGVIRANGADRLESVTIASLDARWRPEPGTEETIQVDALAVGHGFTPRLELAVAAGCELTAERFVRVDDRQLTSVPGVFAAGEITGIGGVDLALAEGDIAGRSAAGALTPARALGDRATFGGFAARIEAAHGIRDGWTGWLTDDTIVCRCEEVTVGALRSAIDQTKGASLRSIKLVSRAGLGICQGRVCGRSVEHILGTGNTGTAREARTTRAGDATTDRRPIALPIRLSELATEPPRERTAPPTPNEHNKK